MRAIENSALKGPFTLHHANRMNGPFRAVTLGSADPGLRPGLVESAFQAETIAHGVARSGGSSPRSQ